MRNLFLALVLANLASPRGARGSRRRSAWAGRADDGLPAMTLVSEVPADLRSSGVVVEQTAAPEPPAGDPPSRRCTIATRPSADRSASPSPTPPSARAAGRCARCSAPTGCDALHERRAVSRAVAGRDGAARRCARPAISRCSASPKATSGSAIGCTSRRSPTEQEANEILAKVRAEGITDSYVIPNSDSGNLVSLGVFSEISGVSRRREQVRALGFEPEVVDRTRRATVYWVDVMLAPEQTLDFDALQPPGRIIRLEQRNCEAAG